MESYAIWTFQCPSSVSAIYQRCTGGPFGHCKRANWKLGLRNVLHFSVSRGVIQRKERGPAKWQLAAYNRVHNKRMADGDWPTSTVNPQRYLQTRPSGTGSLEQYKIRPTC